MRTLVLLTALLAGCGQSGGGSAAASAPALNPTPPIPNVQWFEVNSTCQEVVPGWFWARFDAVTKWIMVFSSLDDCQHHPLNANPKIKNAGECYIRSSYLYGTWNFCYSTDVAGLADPADAWLTVEEQ